MANFNLIFYPFLVLVFGIVTSAQVHDLEELPYLGHDTRGVASVRPHVHCPYYPRPGEEVRVTANFYHQIKNYGNQPMRGMITYSICDSLDNCETEQKRYYVGVKGHTDGNFALTLVQRYGPEHSGARMTVHADSSISGSVTTSAQAMCYYYVRNVGHYHTRYDWSANKK